MSDHPALLSDKAIEVLWYAMRRENPQVRDRKLVNTAVRQAVEWLDANSLDMGYAIEITMVNWEALCTAVGFSHVGDYETEIETDAD